MLTNSEYKVFHGVFGKLTVMVCKLPNGFTLVGSYGWLDPVNGVIFTPTIDYDYDSELGDKLCKEHILDQLIVLEGYALTAQAYSSPHIKGMRAINFPINMNEDNQQYM